MKLTYTCPICSKRLSLKQEHRLGDTILNEYTCGHVFSHEHAATLKELDFNAADGSGKSARHYQEDGIKFIFETEFNAIIADQMRLGKTPQSLIALKNAYADRTPCLILVKGANLWQWIREYKTWTDPLMSGIYPIQGGDAFIPPGFRTYICSMDTFSLNARCTCGHAFHDKGCRSKTCECRSYTSQGNSIRDKLKLIPFKLIIADEAHSYKNSDSNRSQALTEFVQFLNSGEETRGITFTCSRCSHEWQEEGKLKYDKRIGHTVIAKSSRCPECDNYCYVQQQHKMPAGDRACGLILLTGTPILNRADEYFVPLNLVAPEKFSSLVGFQRSWLRQDSKGHYSSVKSYLVSDFKKTIAPFFLRREKEDVYTDLPRLNKIFTVIEPDKDSYAKEYNRIIDKMDAKLAEKANPSFWEMAEHFSELRRICGMMKIAWTTDYLESCALESANKYAIGIHHQAVRDLLYLKLGMEKNCYKLSGEDNPERKDWIMRNWEHSDKQFLIINMLAGGVGMDFHYCNNVLTLERQWNAEMERQFEFRFYNPDKSIKTASTEVEYIVAKGTFDEFMYDLIEYKMHNVDPLVYNNWNLQTDAATFKELVERTVSARL